MLELKKKKISLFISLFVAAQGLPWGFPGSSAGREPAWNAGDPSSIPGSHKIPWRRGRLPTQVFLGFPGGSDGKEPACNAGDLGLIPGLGRSLEESMATHSSILAWRIPWTEEPGGLQSTGSQRVGHVWATKRSASQRLLYLWHPGLVAPWHVGSSRTRDPTHIPCIGRWILNHWTTREVC